MKVSKEQVAQNRKKILFAAARLFRLRGIGDVGLSEIMNEAGLTHGAFYGYFPSKEALVAETFERALPSSPDVRSAADFADAYLSVRHRDNRATSCLFSSLGTEAARATIAVRRSMTAAARQRIAHLTADAKGTTRADRRRSAIAAWSAMVGAMILARIVDDPKLSKEILSETRALLPLK